MRGKSETLEQRIQRVVREEVAIATYDPTWPEAFRQEKEHLLSCLPKDLIRRVEHFGSTAVPGLAPKAIADVPVEVAYIRGKTEFIVRVTEQAKRYYGRA
jgi:GrpB-like predicted nucleotidyltransferase (UPF0157 family)